MPATTGSATLDEPLVASIVDELVDAAPPLSADQVSTLSALLGGVR